MAQRLHLVFGGELLDPARTEFRDVNDIHIVGISRIMTAPITHGNLKRSAQ